MELWYTKEAERELLCAKVGEMTVAERPAASTT